MKSVFITEQTKNELYKNLIKHQFFWLAEQIFDEAN